MKNAMNHEFTGRKPSTRQALAKAKQFANQGADFVSLTWGENWIDLTKDNGFWHGHGWLKDVDGAWIARELNHSPVDALAKRFGYPVEFLRDKLTIVNVKHADYDEFGVNLNNSFNTKG